MTNIEYFVEASKPKLLAEGLSDLLTWVFATFEALRPWGTLGVKEKEKKKKKDFNSSSLRLVYDRIENAYIDDACIHHARVFDKVWTTD